MQYVNVCQEAKGLKKFMPHPEMQELQTSLNV